MKGFGKLVLCEEYGKEIDIHVWASLADDELTISGQDLGPRVEGDCNE